MAYIDLDEINRLHPKLTAKYPLSFANGISAAISEINKLPNAAVVPKSEVESIITLNSQLEAKVFEERKEVERLKHILDCYALQYGTVKEQQAVIDKANQELASEIFAEIKKKISSMKYNAKTKRKTVKVEELKEQVDWVLHEVIPNAIAEIEKKYTEQCPDCKHFVGCEKAVWSGRCEDFDSVRKEDELYEKGYHDAIKDIEELIRGMK